MARQPPLVLCNSGAFGCGAPRPALGGGRFDAETSQCALHQLWAVGNLQRSWELEHLICDRSVS